MKIINRSNISKTIQYFKKNGAAETFYAAKERIALKAKSRYSYEEPGKDILDMQTFISINYDLSGVDGDKCRPVPQNIEEKPKITVVMPAYETSAEYLKAAVDSIINQSYPAWELVIADASESSTVKDVISGYANAVVLTQGDIETKTRVFEQKRIVYTRLNQNLGISENTNAALKQAKGDYIALLDHDDCLTPDALFRMAVAAAHTKTDENGQVKGPALIYSDEDKTDSEGHNFFEPHIKPDFNYDLLLTNNYICHLSCIRKDMFDTIGLRSEYDGAQDYDLVLRIVEKLIREGKDPDGNIAHVPYVLYHWRCHEASTAANTSSKLYAYEAGLKALQAHMDSLYPVKNAAAGKGTAEADAPGVSAITAEHSKHLGFYRLTYENGKIFGARPDVGAVIGRRFDRSGKMLPILWDENGCLLYAGLNRHSAGEFNRFDCSQDVEVGDIRYLKLAPGLADRYVEYLGEAENMNREGCRDMDSWYLLSRKICMALHADGYRIVYIPD